MRLSPKVMSAAFLLALLLIPHMSWADDNLPEDSLSQPVERALRAALRYTGFSSLEGYTPEAIRGPELVAERDDNTPFLHRYFSGGMVWRVGFKGVVVTPSESKFESSHELARDFDVYIEPQSGRLLKIASTTPNKEWPYPPPGSASQREEKLRKAGVTSMVLPDQLPVSFTTVLEKSGYTPYKATELVAVYVTVSCDQWNADRTRWELSLRGIPPVPVFGADDDTVPIEQRTTVTVVSDPATGEMIGATIPAR